MKQRNYRRKKLMVNPRLQLLIMWQSVVIGFFCIVAVHLSYFEHSVVVLYLPVIGFIPTYFFKFLPMIGLFLSFWWSFYFSNRIAGPIYSIEKQLKINLQNGTLENVSCRKDDYLCELVKLINLNIQIKNKTDTENATEK